MKTINKEKFCLYVILAALICIAATKCIKPFKGHLKRDSKIADTVFNSILNHSEIIDTK